MEYIKATPKDIEQIYQIVQTTVTTIYPNYYPKEVVDFFCALHNREAIARDVVNGNAGILLDNHQIVGTGSHDGNHITRVYVLPEFQKKGYGNFIMECLENEMKKTFSNALLDASLPAACLYEHRGYHTKKHERYPVQNGVILVYEVMEKQLSD